MTAPFSKAPRIVLTIFTVSIVVSTLGGMVAVAFPVALVGHGLEKELFIFGMPMSTSKLQLVRVLVFLRYIQNRFKFLHLLYSLRLLGIECMTSRRKLR